MHYYDKTLLALNEVKNEDENIITLFIFGSFVTKDSSSKNYKEIRVLDGSQFLFSKFNLMNIYPDVDILCVSKNVSNTVGFFDKKITEVFGHYVTINVVSKEVFEKEIFSDQPSAIKRVLLYRQLLIIKGEEYINMMKEGVKKIATKADLIFQQEFDFKKEYLKLFAKYDVQSVTITKADYERLFPHLLEFITGNLHGGFPNDRAKLVYPKPMELKASVDLSGAELKEII